jgi:outer membrane receptor protein involved in Fe transport
MVRSLLLTFALLFSVSALVAQSTTVLQGKVADDKGEALIGATVKVLNGTDVVRGAISDYDGNYRITLDPGTYDVEVSYTGFSTQRTSGVKVLYGKLNSLDIEMSATVLNEVVIKEFKVALIEQDNTSTGQTLTSDQIKNLPTRSVNAIVATTAGTSSIDGGAINIKGSRSNATNYYIDGIRVSGSTPPVQDIEQLQVVTGGLGAEYGDVTGGVISVVTKGPASEYHGAVEVENSHGLDQFGWLLTQANVSGPLIKRTRADGSKETMLGFRLSGQYLTQKDDGAPAIPVYRAQDEVLKRIADNPLTLINGNIVSTAETLTNDSVDVLKARPFEDRRDIDVTGKLDFRVNRNIDLSITGTYKDVQNQFTPGGWRLLNAQNNPTAYDKRYRGIFRFRHRLGNPDKEAENNANNRVAISNARYQLQFGFDRGLSEDYDPRHQDRLFDYGYVGRFGFDYEPFGGPSPRGLIEQIDVREVFTGFQAGYVDQSGNVVTPNPGLVPYNDYANDEFYFTHLARNGFLSGAYNNIWSGMHSNVGLVYNNYAKSQADIITIMASSSFDLKLGRTGTHSFQFGLINEQRVERSYALAPFGLWNYMEQAANQHFNGLDTTLQTGNYWDPVWSPIIGDSLAMFANATVDLPDNKFYREVRNSLGIPLNEYVNVHELRPDQLSLAMFSPRELTEQQFVGYYGYDYLGNQLEQGVTFNDFFTTKDADGLRTFPVAPLQPLYQGAYLKDKFTFNKMIFSLGVRVERFDLNTKVMRDQYSLYEVMGAGQAHASVPGLGNKPSNIGDDYKVYVESESNPIVTAYRNGDTWYFPDGTQANDGNLVFGGGVVNPLLLDTISGDDIYDERFNPNSAFEDYTPQVNWLPRLAFSFPISEEANFFAHYDVLVQRPPSNWQVTPLNYLYFYTPGRTPENNANLLPERVVDYEVGFQQRLNQNSALKLSAYYREMRDMIQSRTILYVPTIGRYNTFGNIDFGTVKGFTVQYDLRRVQNAEFRLAYTLQFADGTGSNATSQRGLTTRGNIRTLYPLSFDERHNIQGILDYRFASGDAYNGPRVNGADILSNFGVNLQFNAVSGRPYTSTLRPTRFGGIGTVGSINGNRLPWRFNVNLRVDKSFRLTEAGKRPLNLNVYFRVSNLLNTKNITGVYSYSGSPSDDGYLATAEGQTLVQGVVDQGKNPDAYLASYSWVMLNAGFYTLPRRLYAGAVFEF